MKRQAANENITYHAARITFIDALIALIASVFALLLYLRIRQVDRDTGFRR